LKNHNAKTATAITAIIAIVIVRLPFLFLWRVCVPVALPKSPATCFWTVCLVPVVSVYVISTLSTLAAVAFSACVGVEVAEFWFLDTGATKVRDAIWKFAMLKSPAFKFPRKVLVAPVIVKPLC